MIRIQLLSFIFIFNQLLFSDVCANDANPDSIPRFDWHIHQFPKMGGMLTGIFFNDSTGWLAKDNGRLARLEKNKWRRERFLLLEDPNNLFYADKLYIVTKSQNAESWHIYFYDQGDWQKLNAPNSDKIRDVQVIAPDNIWAACEWGELLHFNGRKWNLIAGPSFMHNNAIFWQSDTSLWVAGEYYNKITIFRWNGKHWFNYDHAHSGSKDIFFPEVNRILPLKNDICIGIFRTLADSILIIKHEEIRQESWSFLVKDSLEIFIPYYHDSTTIFIKQNDLVKVWTGYNRYLSVTSDEFLVIYKTNLEHYGYWKTPTGEIYFVRFLPQKKDVENRLLFKGYPIFGLIYSYGAAFVDIDRDGKEELFIVDTEKKNKLFRIDQEFFRLAEINYYIRNYAEEFNIDGPIKAKNNKYIFDHGVSFADIDNDGDDDGYVTSLYDRNLFYENKNGRIFQEKAPQAGVDIGVTRSVVGIWSDVNCDGLLDLFVTNEDTTNMLFLNQGGGNFTDVTRGSGLETQQRGNSACFGDLDLDGDMDLVVTFQNIRDRIYRNDTPVGSTTEIRFKDVTDEWWPSQEDTNSKSLGCVLADYDNDGDLDLFVVHKIFSNRLYENDGNGHLKDVTLEAGLIDSALSNAAGFFDADNDGDLDLYVANRGRDNFYENMGNKHFVINNVYFSDVYNFNSTAFSFGDPDDDGDLDCFLSRGFRGKSKFFRNELNNNNFIKIKLVGVLSNRSAIGAKTFLYEAGHLDEKEFCMGLREVASNNGYAGMNSRTIHYGVDPLKRYDLRVVFPSGITIIRRAISPGTKLEIVEQQGFAVALHRIDQILNNAVYKRDNQLNLAKFLIVVLLLFIAGRVLVFKKVLSGADLRYFYTCGVLTFVFAKVLFGYLAVGYQDLFSFLITFLMTTIIVSFMTKRKVFLSRDVLIEELYLACRNFGHGAWAMSYLNQIQLFSVNLRKKEKIDQKITEEIQDTIIGFYENIYKEILKISQIAKRTTVHPDKAIELERNLLELSEILNKIKLKLSLQQKMGSELWERAYQNVENIKKNIKLFGSETGKYFQCDLVKVLKKTIEYFQKQNICSIRHNLNQGEKRVALMRAPDLIAIFENLLSNAYEAFPGDEKKEIWIEVGYENGCATVRVRDRGIGIPRKYWEAIFRQNYSTKRNKKGGFGLYFAKTKLEKFGGSIRVEKSSAKSGTTILMTIPIV